jgi:hypothetical protein
MTLGRARELRESGNAETNYWLVDCAREAIVFRCPT